VKNINFSGSYLKSDVTFLLKLIEIEDLAVDKKEKLIQSGKKHYSEMISPEYQPSEKYLNIFYKSLELNIKRFSQDILNFAFNIPQNSIIVSLARAGTPIGVLVKRIAHNRRNIDFPHYSISIIRDRGIDENALKYILEKHPKQDIFFIDGWTGKGVISRELKQWITKFNKKNNTNIKPNLAVISDISGKADFSVSTEDYLIPSSALNSTISGLVSRTILNSDYIKDNDFHGCKFYSELQNSDLSLWFVDKIVKFTETLKPTISNFLTQDFKQEKMCKNYIAELMDKFSISDINFIKPGIAETTRVLLRRIPYMILLQDINSDEVQHLIQLANEKGVIINEIKNLPYTAIGIIKKLKEING